MSGGVGPTYNDITLPKEEEEEQHHKHLHDQTSTKTHRSLFTPTGASPAGFLTFRQLNSLAVIVVFSASGLVLLEDLIFVFFSLILIYFLSRVAFPPRNSNSSHDGPLTNPSNKIFQLYVTAAGIVGLVIPICYILEGFFEGDKSGVQAAAPHVFLLASQLFMEGVAATRGFSAPIRVLVPIFYNARRILTLVDWTRGVFTTEIGTVSQRRIYAGKVLAMVNLGLWSFNLFGLLLPVYLPRAFKRYYGENTKQN